MAKLNLRNGNPHQWIEAHEVTERWEEIEPLYEVLVNVMDDETREMVVAELAPCEEPEFLTRYLELATDDLVIG